MIIIIIYHFGSVVAFKIELPLGKAMVAYSMPKQEERGKQKAKWRGRSEQVKFIYFRFDRR